MPIFRYLLLILFLTFSLAFSKNDDDLKALAKQIDIPFQKFVLKNGLTLIVHEDHKAPIVAVNVWYHVGSKNEKPGKTGFAHLFEHLMFNGSENYNDEYFKPFEKVGATGMNGTTNRDRTNYFETVPVNALDMALWMESDRMGHLIGAIDQAKLDEQRGVVQNEKRQGENQPYGKVWTWIVQNTYPKGHPYSWTTIGSMEDLNAASLEDVHEWFKNYYGAANAYLVIAGDINTDSVRQKVEQYFGDVPPGPPVTKHDVWIAKMQGTHRMVAEDRVPQARIWKVWNIPQWGSKEAVMLDLASSVLGSGKNSRLYKRLVYKDQIATDVSATVYLGEIGGQFMISAAARPGVDLKKVEKAIDEELQKFLQKGPSEKELKRVKVQHLSRFVKGIEQIGGFRGKANILAKNEVFGGSPDYFKKTVNWVVNAAPKAVHAATKKWLSDGVFILEVHPFPKYSTTGKDVDRSKLPETGTPPEPKFPAYEKIKLDNGLEIFYTKRTTVPVVNMSLVIDAGYAADQFASPGTANMTLTMLDEGTPDMSSLEISEKLDMLGANLRAGSNLDVSFVHLNVLKTTLPEAMRIYSEVILHPTFPQKELERLKKQIIAGIKREQSQPVQMALRVLPRFLYGIGHAYGNPLTGSGTIESVKKMTRDDLIKFHKTWFKSNNAKLIVVGNIERDELEKLVKKYFGKWKAGTVPQKNISDVDLKPAQILLIDKPASEQSLIIAGQILPPKSDPDNLAIEMMNKVLGGTFTSRLNMNLREEKHWSYGARTIVADARGPSLFFAYAPVQIDKTKESIQEMLKEINDVRSEKPVTPEELEKVKNNEILKLPGTWETGVAVLRSIQEIVTFGLPEDFWTQYPNLIRSLSLDQVQSAAKKALHPDHLIWVVVGDRSKIEEPLRQLGVAEVKVIDVEGNVIE
ncbi:M16 family metallopeptidase [Calditrichota bacterium GD2]